MKKVFIVFLLIVSSFTIIACQDTETTTTEFSFTPNPETNERSGYLDIYVGINQLVFEVNTQIKDITRNIYLISDNDEYYIDENNINTSDVDTSTPGEYSIYIDVYQNDEVVGTYSISILIKEGQVPVFTHVENYHLNVYDDLPNFLNDVMVADDNLDEVIVEEEVNTSYPGVYQVRYIAKDLDGNETISYSSVLVGHEYSEVLIQNSQIRLYELTSEETETINQYIDLIKMVYTNDSVFCNEITHNNGSLLTKGIYEQITNRDIRPDELNIIEAYREIKVKDEIKALELLYNRNLTTAEIESINLYRRLKSNYIDYLLGHQDNIFYDDILLYNQEMNLDLYNYLENTGMSCEDFHNKFEEIKIANFLLRMQSYTEKSNGYDPNIDLDFGELLDIVFHSQLDELIQDPNDTSIPSDELALIFEHQTYTKKFFYTMYINTENLDYLTYESAYDLVVDYVKDMTNIKYDKNMYLYPGFINVLTNFYKDLSYETLTQAERELYISLVNNIDFGYYYEFDTSVTEEEKAMFISMLYSTYGLGTDLCTNCRSNIISIGTQETLENRLGRPLTAKELTTINKYRDGEIKIAEDYFMKYFWDYNLSDSELAGDLIHYSNIFYRLHNLLDERDPNYQDSIDILSYFVFNDCFDYNDWTLLELKSYLEKPYTEFYNHFSTEWSLDSEGLSKLEDLYNIDFKLYDDLEMTFISDNQAYYHDLDIQLKTEDLTLYNIACEELDYYLNQYANYPSSNTILYDDEVKELVLNYIVSNNKTLKDVLETEDFGSSELVVKYLTMLRNFTLAESTNNFLVNLDNYNDYIGLEKDLAELGFKIVSYYDIDVLLNDSRCSSVHSELTVLKNVVLETAIQNYFKNYLDYHYEITDYTAFNKFKDVHNIYRVIHERNEEEIIKYYYNNIDDFTQSEQVVVNLYMREELGRRNLNHSLRDYITVDEVYNVYVKLIDSGVAIENLLNDRFASYSAFLNDFEKFVYFSSKDVNVDTLIKLEELLDTENYSKLSEIFRVGVYDEYYSKKTPYESYIQAKALSRDLTQAEITAIDDYIEYIYYPNEVISLNYSYFGEDYFFNDNDLREITNVLARVNQNPNNDPMKTYDFSYIRLTDDFLQLYESIENLTLTTQEQRVVDMMWVKLMFTENESNIYLYENEDYFSTKLDYFKLVYQVKGSELNFAMIYLEYQFTEVELSELTQAELDLVEAYNELVAYERLEIVLTNRVYSNYGTYTFNELADFTSLLDLFYEYDLYMIGEVTDVSLLETELGVTFTQTQLNALEILFPEWFE